MPLEPEIAAKLLDADLVNIAKRIQDGKPVTKVQRDLLEDSAKDLINYSSFIVAYCRQGIDGQDGSKDYLNREIKKVETNDG